MPIIGIESVTYGVDDVRECVGFFDDFGLKLERHDADGADFALPEGSHVYIRHRENPILPRAYTVGPSVREVVWGVDDRKDIEALGLDLRTDREVTCDNEGTLRFSDDLGIPIGLKYFDRCLPAAVPYPTNGPGRPERINKARAWYPRATPQSIQHVVFGVPEVERAMNFYCERLRFRITDISLERGIFARCDGRNDHHNLFFLQADDLKWLHIAFDVQNLDELMAGANYMQRHGWKSAFGIGRHRVSSSIFYYIESPCGGECEYSADTDFVDNKWKPCVWDPQFGNVHWLANLPARFMEEPREDFRILEREATVHDFRKPK